MRWNINQQTSKGSNKTTTVLKNIAICSTISINFATLLDEIKKYEEIFL